MTLRRLLVLLTALMAAVLVAPSPAAADGAHPTNLRTTGSTYDSVSLAWDPSPGSVTYYQILRNGVWVDSAYSTAATVRYLSSGTTYTVSVRARYDHGSVSPSATTSATTRRDSGPPSAPANLRVDTDGHGTKLGLRWDSATDDRGVAMYWLFANGDVVFGGGLDAGFLELTEVFCTVFHGETYTFEVRAMDLSGNVSSAGTPLTIQVP